MGANMARRLMQDGHQCVVFDLDPANVSELASEGATPSVSLEDFISKLKSPRVGWVMVPAGPATENTVAELGDLMEPADIIIDGGNSYYKDDVRRSRELGEKKIRYVDVGTSGGVWGILREPRARKTEKEPPRRDIFIVVQAGRVTSSR